MSSTKWIIFKQAMCVAFGSYLFYILKSAELLRNLLRKKLLKGLGKDSMKF